MKSTKFFDLMKQFLSEGKVNRPNAAYCPDANLLQTVDREPTASGVVVWAEIWSEGILGPSFFEKSVKPDTSSYMERLSEKGWMPFIK